MLPVALKPMALSQAQDWDNIAAAGGSRAIQVFYKLWYEDSKLTPEEDRMLRKLFQQYPLGETNFRAWRKQRVRQLFERSVKEHLT